MRVAVKRWGEVTIKQQGEQKNQFDSTKSFSIQKTKHEYTIDQLKHLFMNLVDLSEHYTYGELHTKLNRLETDG